MIYVVSGSRWFPSEDLVRLYMAQEFKYKGGTLIHGTARGVDQWCAEEADRAHLSIMACPANWDQYGKSAGAIRNAKMINEAADYLDKGEEVLALIFWDGTSRGTQNFFQTLKQTTKIPYRLITMQTRDKT